MPEFGTSIFSRKNFYRVFGVASIITITALVVVIVKGSHESSGVSDENNAEIGPEIPSPPEGCYPEPDGKIPQFIIGYGSLMQTASKLRTYPNASENIPVLVHDFSRHWNIQGQSVGYSTTYLGVQQSSGSLINAVIFRIPETSQANLISAISNYDKRERFYCRVEVLAKNIVILNRTEELDQFADPKEKKAQFWIYFNRPVHSKPANARYPIVQSYVDIFISGCIELEEKFQLKEFADQCITTTEGWSTHWVNDRILPRRPWTFTPAAGKIDALLAKHIPDTYKSIKIEG